MINFGGADRPDTPFLVRAIVAGGKAADEEVIAAAMSLREVRRRVEAGEEGVGEKWHGWARKNIPLCETKLYQLQAIAYAKDPHAELERQRRLGRERSKRCRGPRETSESSPERYKLKKWADDAAREDLIKVWQYAERLQRLRERPLCVATPSAKRADAVTSNDRGRHQ